MREDKHDAATIRAQAVRYHAQGFPDHARLMENNVLVRRHNTPAMIELAQAWWEEIARGSRRDQLSFPFIAAQRSLRIALLGPVGNNARNDPRLRFFSHSLPRPAKTAGTGERLAQNSFVKPAYTPRRGPNCGAPTPMPEPSRSS